MFSYQTGIFSGSYRLSDVVDALKEHMRLDGVLKSSQLIFVCHSMGGIVARKFVLERAVELSDAKKTIDLFLIASPSQGSTYADWLSPIAKLFGHAQADALRFIRDNIWLNDLNKEFRNLKEDGKLKIRGKELVEDKFIALKALWGKQIVEPFSGATYFPDPFKVPASDHFSIAKPSDKNAIQHRLLCRYILENTPSLRTEEAETQTETTSQSSVAPFSRSNEPFAPSSSTPFSQVVLEETQANPNGPEPDSHIPTVIMTSVSAIDEKRLDSTFENFGTNWHEAKILWPRSSNDLLAIIQRAVERFDDEGTPTHSPERKPLRALPASGRNT